MKPNIIILDFNKHYGHWQDELLTTYNTHLQDVIGYHLFFTRRDNTYSCQRFVNDFKDLNLLLEAAKETYVEFSILLNLKLNPQHVFTELAKTLMPEYIYYHGSDMDDFSKMIPIEIENINIINPIEYHHADNDQHWRTIKANLFKDPRSNIKEYLHNVINKIKQLEWSLPNDLDDFSDFVQNKSTALQLDFRTIEQLFDRKEEEIKNSKNENIKELLNDLEKYRDRFEKIKQTWNDSRHSLSELKNAIKEWNK